MEKETIKNKVFEIIKSRLFLQRYATYDGIQAGG